MKLKSLFIIKALVSLFFGILLLAFPTELGSILGLELSPSGIFMAREYGGALVGIFFLCWVAGNSSSSKALKGIILFGFVYDFINLFVSVHAKLSGVLNSTGWAIVAVYLVFAVGFGYFLFINPPEG